MLNNTVEETQSYLPDDVSFLASIIRQHIESGSIIGKLLSYAIDIISDDVLSDEFYQSFPELMLFLSDAGTTVDEIKFRAYVYTHPDIFICKKCKSVLVGGCPIMYCSNPECNKSYYIEIDGISSSMCKKCVASAPINTCSEGYRNRLFKIYAINRSVH